MDMGESDHVVQKHTLRNESDKNQMAGMAAVAEQLARGEAERAALSLRAASLAGALARDASLARGAVPALLPHLRPRTPPRVLLPAVQALSNLCRHTEDEPAVQLELVSPALPLLRNLLDDGDPHVLEAACAVVVNLTYCGKFEYIDAVQSVDGLTERLLVLLGHEASIVKRPALAAVANLLAGDTTQVERCVEAGCLDYVMPLLRSSDALLVQHAARALANIFIHTSATQKALEKDILYQLQDVLEHGNHECQKQVVKAIGNLCYHGTADQRVSLVSSGILRTYCVLLVRPDHTLAELVLPGLQALLQATEDDEIDDLMDCNYSGIKDEAKFLYSKLVEIDLLDVIEQLLQIQEIDENLRRQAQQLSVDVRWFARGEDLIFEDETIFTPKMIIKDLKCIELVGQVTAARVARRILRRARASGPDRLQNVSDSMMNVGLLNLLQAALAQEVCPELQYEAAWIFVYITFVEDHRTTVQYREVIPQLVSFIAKEDQIAIPAAYALGNLALGGRTAQLAAVNNGAIESIRRLLHPETPLQYLMAYLSAYKGICFINWYMNNGDILAYIKLALPFLPQLLDMDDQRVLVLVCGVLQNLMMKSDDGRNVVEALPEVTTRLTSLLGHEAPEVQEAALKAVKYMFQRYSYQEEEHSIDIACLDQVARLLRSSNPVIVKEATSAIANMLNLAPSLAQRAMDHDVLTPLLNLLSKDELDECQVQAARSIGLMCSGGLPEHRAHVVSRGVLQHCNALLAARDDTPMEHAATLRDSLIRELTEHVCSILREVMMEIEGVDAVLNEPGLMKRVLILLGNETANMQRHALYVLDRMMFRVKGTTDKVKCCFDQLVALLRSNETIVVERAVRATWEILCESSFGQMTISDKLLPALLDILTDGELRCQVEAALAIGNLCIRDSACITSSTVLERCNALLATRHATPAPDAPAGREDLAQELTEQVVLLIRCVMMYCEDGVDAVQAESGLTERLVALLGHEAPKLQEAALMVVFYMLSGTDTQAKHCIEHVVLFLRSDRPALVEGAVRAMGDVFAGTQPQIEMALDIDVLSPLLDVLASGEPECQTIAVQAATNFCRFASPAQCEQFISGGVLGAYCGLLARPDLPKPAVGDILNGLDWLLQIEHPDFNGEALRSQLKEMCVRAELDKLMQHEDESIKREVDKLLKKHMDL